MVIAMRRTVLLIAIVAGCGGGGRGGGDGGGTDEIGGPNPDGAPPDTDDRVCECFQERGCENGNGLSTPSTEVPCDQWTTAFCTDHWSYPCMNGCAIESVGLGADLGNGVDPAVFCAEAPTAQVGDSCGVGCLPTRATADATGKVSQLYLACDQATQRCAAALAPTVSRWMAPCPLTAAAWGAPGVNGRAGASQDAGAFCLLAWDASTATVANGLTITCLGDWDCPAGAMCDDHVARLQQTDDQVQAVCRPGPRGTPIDPARLHP